MIFEIPYPPTKRGKAAWNKRFGLNAYYAGKHWSQRKRDAEELHSLALWSMKKAHIRKQFVKGPVEVIFRWNDGLDADNHAATRKAFVLWKEEIDHYIMDEIIKMCKEHDITDLYVLNRDFILSAIKEKMEKEAHP